MPNGRLKAETLLCLIDWNFVVLMQGPCNYALKLCIIWFVFIIATFIKKTICYLLFQRMTFSGCQMIKSVDRRHFHEEIKKSASSSNCFSKRSANIAEAPNFAKRFSNLAEASNFTLLFSYGYRWLWLLQVQMVESNQSTYSAVVEPFSWVITAKIIFVHLCKKTLRDL